MKNRYLNSITKLKITGLNFDKFFVMMNLNDIELFDLKRLSYNELVLSVKQYDYSKFMKLIKPLNYKIENLKYGGVGLIKYLFFKRLGVFLGLLISVILFIIVNNFTFNFTVLGLENINRELVIEEINKFGVKPFKINNFNNGELEKYLTEKIKQISLVSVKKKGTTLIVNIKEKLPEITEEFVPIYSDYNFIIETINVYSGSSKYKVGDIIKKGDILVEPYIISNDQKVMCKPVAEITGKAYFTSSIEFQEKSIELQRTGKSVVVESNYELGGKTFLKNKKKNNFNKFELETKTTNLFNNFFLPIKINKTIAYELKEVEVVKSFDENKENLEKEVLKNAKSKIINNLNIDEEKIIITKTENKYYVNCYICCIIKIG